MSLNEYKQRVIAEFNSRTNYDNDFRDRLGNRLVELAQLKSGQTILDVATGTGIIAIAAAKIVGDEGKVVGVDISSGMLKQAEQKIAAANLKNIELLEIDADYLNFTDECFDRILCSSALVYLSSIPAALRSWYRFLKKSGVVGFSTFADGSFNLAMMFTEIAQNYGVYIPDLKAALNTPEKCRKILQESGFRNVEIKIEQFGYYMSIEDVETLWNQLANNGLIKPVLNISSAELAEFKAKYLTEAKKLETERGIWNDVTTFFGLAQKF